jgi:uncharacterized protein YgiM (DUF1202 family)
MKAKHLRLVLPMLTAVLIFAGCGNSQVTNKDVLDLLNTSDSVTIELSIEGDEVAGYTYSVDWIQLGDMESSESVRTSLDEMLLISGSTGNKNGVFYVNESGENTQNNTLAVVMRNTAFTKNLTDSTSLKDMNYNLVNNYIDLDSGDEAIYTAISDYFELLVASDSGESNINDQLSRAEAMNMVFRAMNEVDTSISEDSDFTSAVGENNLNLLSAKENSKVFISTTDGSLNETTYTQSMTKAEFIYLVMNEVFGTDAINNADATVQLESVANAGDIINSENVSGKNQAHSAVLKVFIDDPTSIDETLYKAAVLADSKGIDTDNLDSAITKGEAVEILCKALMQNPNIKSFNYTQGSTDSGYVADLRTDEDKAADAAAEAEGLAELESEAAENGEEIVSNVNGYDNSDEEDTEITEEVSEQAGTRTEEQVQEEAIFGWNVEEMSKTMYAQKDCNLREGPSTDFDKVGSLSKNTKVTVTGQTEYNDSFWYRIDNNGSVAYVSAKLLGDSKVETSNKKDTTTKTDTSSNKSDDSSKKDTSSKSDSSSNKSDSSSNSDNTKTDTSSSSNNVGSDNGKYDAPDMDDDSWIGDDIDYSLTGHQVE